MKPVKTVLRSKVKKCGGGFLAGLCHKKASCAPAPCDDRRLQLRPDVLRRPMASGQSYPTPQATGQSYTPPVPSKR